MATPRYLRPTNSSAGSTSTPSVPAPSRFNTDKLNWLNQEHLKRLPETELGRRFAPYLERAGLDTAAGPAPGAVALLLRDRAATLVAMAEAARYFYSTPVVPADALAAQVNDANRPALVELHGEFAKTDWTREAIGAAIKAAAARHGLKAPQLMMPLRVLVAGTPQTPAIDAVLALIGRDHVRSRMASGLAL